MIRGRKRPRHRRIVMQSLTLDGALDRVLRREPGRAERWRPCVFVDGGNVSANAGAREEWKEGGCEHDLDTDLRVSACHSALCVVPSLHTRLLLRCWPLSPSSSSSCHWRLEERRHSNSSSDCSVSSLQRKHRANRSLDVSQS